MDLNDIITLNTNENTVQFNIVGYYKISIILSGYANSGSQEFEPTTDFISVGFRLVGTDDIFIGASEWTYTDEPIQVSASGIISVNNISNVYELVNLSQSTLNLNTPEIEYIESESYFTNSLITIIVEYLGR